MKSLNEFENKTGYFRFVSVRERMNSGGVASSSRSECLMSIWLHSIQLYAPLHEVATASHWKLPGAFHVAPPLIAQYLSRPHRPPSLASRRLPFINPIQRRCRAIVRSIHFLAFLSCPCVYVYVCVCARENLLERISGIGEQGDRV